MATHVGTSGLVKVGGTTVGEVIGFSIDETQDTVLLYQQIENERYCLLFKFGLLYIAFSLVMILLAVWIALWYGLSVARRLARL